ncbi:MAG: hypothetical protein K2X06_09235 [Burkholderiales bacterium]|nr:hypothetical protein [Burkholderiales bacterium]
MSKHNFAAIITTVLLSAAGTVHAASPFPSAAQEDSAHSVNIMLPAAVSGLSGAESVFPSAAREDGGHNEQYAVRSAPRNLEHSFAGGHGGVFPGASME